jgi:hypothetical protein
MAPAVPQHLDGLVDPAAAGRLPPGPGDPFGVLALVGEREAVEGVPGRDPGGVAQGAVDRQVGAASSTVSKRWDAMGRP